MLCIDLLLRFNHSWIDKARFKAWWFNFVIVIVGPNIGVDRGIVKSILRRKKGIYCHWYRPQRWAKSNRRKYWFSVWIRCRVLTHICLKFSLRDFSLRKRCCIWTWSLTLSPRTNSLRVTYDWCSVFRFSVNELCCVNIGFRDSVTWNVKLVTVMVDRLQVLCCIYKNLGSPLRLRCNLSLFIRPELMYIRYGW